MIPVLKSDARHHWEPIKDICIARVWLSEGWPPRTVWRMLAMHLRGWR